MTQVQLNKAVCRATGEDYDLIDRLGFSLVDEQSPLQEDDMESLIVDWDRVQAEQTTAMFRDRQSFQAA